MTNFLDKVLKYKRAEVEKLKQQIADNRFIRLFSTGGKTLVLIAEIKPKSPTKGRLYSGDLISLAQTYQQAGAHAISVVTDAPSFGGSMSLLKRVKETVGVPVLRKDFILDEAQLVETVQCGADAVLLIVSLVTPKKLKDLIVSAYRLGVAPVIEVYNQTEIKVALEAGAPIIGVNSRNLRTLEVNTENALHILRLVPSHIPALLFSGIETKSDVKAAVAHGAKGVLVGTTLMQEKNIQSKVKELLYG